MPQVILTLPPVTHVNPSSGTPGGSVETHDSGQSFESALARHRAPDKTPAADDVRTVKAAKPDAPADANAPAADELAASGNLLPLDLPPAPVDQTLATNVDAALLLAGEVAALAGTVAGDLQDFSAAPESIAEVLAATAPAPDSALMTPAIAIPVSIQSPVVLPATEGQPFSGSVESSLNRAAVSSLSTRSAAADAQTLAALTAEAAGTMSGVKSPDLTSSTDMFRAVLKEIAPAADARSAVMAQIPAAGMQTASSFTNALASAPAGVPVPGASITVPFGQAGWGQAFGNQVVWAVNQGMPAAELHLSPPDLGPMSVRISMDQDQASIAFSSSHAMVREAIEAALPRLRDMLGSQGITLMDVNVSQHGSADTQREPGEFRNGPNAEAGPGMDSASGTVATRGTVGMLDIYA